MDNTLKFNDFIEMLKTSRDIAEEIKDVTNPEIQVVDEEGNLYYIKDVRIELVANSIVIEFDHDE